MKHLEYHIDNNIVVFYNSILGVEKVYVNGKRISVKFSIFGACHKFKIKEDDYKIRPLINLLKLSGVAFKTYKNGHIIKPENFLGVKDRRKLFFKQILAIVFFLIVYFYLFK